MNFFQKRNNILVSFDDSDWNDASKLKHDLDELYNNSNTEKVRLTAKTIPVSLSLEAMEILLSFSSIMLRKGIKLTWVITPQVNQFFSRLGLENLMGNVEVREAENG